MKEQLIEFETAKLAKEKGFGSVLLYPKCYDNGKLKKRPSFSSGSPTDYGDRFTAAPTQALLQKWLRDECNIHIVLMPDKDTITNGGKMFFNVAIKLDAKDYEYAMILRGDGVIQNVKTYEQALEAGLIEGLKLI